MIDTLINEKKIQVILTGGPSDQEKFYAQQITKHCQHEVINLVGKTSLMQLLALMQQSRFIIAPDTGPAHMGTAAGIPVIGLYASSNPHRTGPYNSKKHWVNAYPTAMRQFNHKNVDAARWGERIRAPEVMDLITVEDVLKKAFSCLEKNA